LATFYKKLEKRGNVIEDGEADLIYMLAKNFEDENALETITVAVCKDFQSNLIIHEFIRI
jgi:hypothetical protein